MSSSDTDPTDLEREGQREADKLEDRSKQLGQDIENVDQDWKQKRADEGVPGAKTPDDADESEDEPEDSGGDREEEPEDSGEDRDEESDEDSKDDSDDKSEDEDSDDKSDEKSDDESDKD